MNTSTLKSFAPAVRRQLMEAVERKLDVVLAAQSPDYLATYARQVESLRVLAKADRAGLVERVAYTWFNRFAALRYLDARGWHPFRARVLTPASPEETQPELLRTARSAGVPEELVRYTDPQRLDDLLDGRIPSADPQGEVYRHLVLAACRYYHGLLPDLFEPLDDETELLLPDDLLTEHSVAHGFRTEISDDDCAEVEVLGWLYQFYISEKKDEVMARRKAVPSEDIPAVTQLFTPHWIVRYLVENSLGRLWLLNRPGSRLREQMPYYIEGEPEEDFLKIERPEEIRLIDPAVGSGHMLVYAFDLLYAIYEEAGYAPSEIAGLILKHNLYGVDIDPRAAQLASLALVLKAREKARRFFQPGAAVRPNVIALEDVRFEGAELRDYVRALDLGELFDAPVLELLGQFENATTFGSLIQPVLGEGEIRQLRKRIEERDIGGDLLLSGTHRKVLRVLEQAEYLTQRYQIAVANPPYMGRSQMNAQLRTYCDTNHPLAKSDLGTVFIERNLALCSAGGAVAMITMQSWMFLASYAAFRTKSLLANRVESLLQLGARAFDSISGEVVSTCAFIVRKHVGPQAGRFADLTFGRNESEKHDHFLHLNRSADFFRISTTDLRALPDGVFSFWLSARQRYLFQQVTPLGDVADLRVGLQTGDNERFLRSWYEVSFSDLRLDGEERQGKWFPYSKGGEFRKWFGNLELVIDWRDDGRHIKNFRDEAGRLRSRPQNQAYYFRPAVEWSDIGQPILGARYRPASSHFDVVSMSLFSRCDDHMELHEFLSYLNTKVAGTFIRAVAPGMHCNTGYVSKLPYIPVHDAGISRRAGECISIARQDWANSDVSWEFRESPLLKETTKCTTLAGSWEHWKDERNAAIRRMQELETENNRLWIDAYGLEDELSPEVPEEEITLARADRRRDVAAFLSYAVGCMMGRYSLDAPGLVLADAGSTVEDYLAKVGKPLEALTFAPDADGILPVLDGDWFEDDIVARTRAFLRATFGEATLMENLRFIEESLGKDLRRYFLTDFYKDHLQTYKKRPIYWMVQSPKKGFSALIYLHRYSRDTLNRVLNGYLREYEAKLRNRLEHLTRVQASDAAPASERSAARREADRLTRVLAECQEWERQTLLPLAQARIELDLDDGVKVNYGKLAGAVAPVSGL